jgi:hypothetical protein
MFRQGACGEFALALHREFGYPLGAFLEMEPNPDYEDDPEDEPSHFWVLAHVFAYKPGTDFVVDVDGTDSKQRVAARVIVPPGRTLQERNYTGKLDELLWEWAPDETVVTQAQRYICANPKRYR